MHWFLGSFVIWIAYRGKIAKYLSFANGVQQAPNSNNTGAGNQ